MLGGGGELRRALLGASQDLHAQGGQRQCVCVCVCAEGDACSMTVCRGASIKLYLLGNAAVGAQVGGRAIFHELYREELCQHWRPIVHLHRAASVHDLWRSAGLCFSKINTRTHGECHC